jgi:hypothetical protein
MNAQMLERLAHRANPWITLIPLWIISSVLLGLIFGGALLVTATLHNRYHMTMDGTPLPLARGEARSDTNPRFPEAAEHVRAASPQQSAPGQKAEKQQ